MASCSACAAPLRPGARFCTTCGAPVAVSEPPPLPMSIPTPPSIAIPTTIANPTPVPLDDSPVVADEVPARVPAAGLTAVPSDRSQAATFAVAAGVAPLVISVVGNLVAAQLGTAAVAGAESGAEGGWAPVLLTLALVFVLNAGSLTLCAILGARGLRETANGVTRGRGLAVAGLAVGGANLVLWVAGLLVSIGGLSAVLS